MNSVIDSIAHPQRDLIVRQRKSPAYQAYEVLHWGFVAAPVIAGLDKFAGVLTDWDKYLAPAIARYLTPTHTFMMIAGALEILAGLIVALKPRVGAYVVATWLAGIIVNLLVAGAFYDVALRDFGLMLGALALGRLAVDFDPPIRAA